MPVVSPAPAGRPEYAAQLADRDEAVAFESAKTGDPATHAKPNVTPTQTATTLEHIRIDRTPNSLAFGAYEAMATISVGAKMSEHNEGAKTIQH